MATVNGNIQQVTDTGLTKGNFGSSGIKNLGLSESGGVSTGWISGGVLTAVGDAAPDISAGVGYVYVTASDSYTRVVWSAVANLAVTDNAVNYISVNSSGVVSATITPPTHTDQRTAIQLGRVSMTSGVISGITSTVVSIKQTAPQLYDLFKAIGPVKSGLALTAVGGNLKIAVASGEIYSQGVSGHTNVNNPNEAEFTGNNPQTFRMFTQLASSGGDITDLPVGSYDNAGTVTAIPGAGSQATIFTVYKFSSGNVRTFYGQTIYTNLSAAVQAIGSYVPVVPASFADAIIIGFIAATKNATDLSQATQATFITTNRFGGVGGAVASAGSFMFTDFSNATGILPILNGGTGSATQNFVDLTTAQTSIGGAKTFTSTISGTVASGTAAAFTGSGTGVITVNTSGSQGRITSSDNKLVLSGASGDASLRAVTGGLLEIPALAGSGGDVVAYANNAGQVGQLGLNGTLSLTGGVLTVLSAPILTTSRTIFGQSFNGSANVTGTATATSFVKTGGTSSEFLMADGSVTTGGSSWTTNTTQTGLTGDKTTSGVITATQFISSAQLNVTAGGAAIVGDLINNDGDLTVSRNTATEAKIRAIAVSTGDAGLYVERASSTPKAFNKFLSGTVNQWSLGLDAGSNNFVVQNPTGTVNVISADKSTNIVTIPTLYGASAKIGTTSTQLGAAETIASYNNSASFALSAVGTSSGVSPIGVWNTATTGDNMFEAYYTEGSPTLRGSISYNRGAGLVAYNTTSDYRIKTDVSAIDGALNMVNLLKPKKFRVFEAENKTLGFFAHELQEVVPQAVTGVKDAVDDEGKPILQQVDVSQIVPLLTKAIQEQQVIIKALEARIKALEP